MFNNNENYTSTEVANLLGIEVHTVNNWRAGMLPNHLQPKRATRNGISLHVYTQKHIEIFEAVKTMRNQQRPYKSIKRYIAEKWAEEPIENPVIKSSNKIDSDFLYKLAEQQVGMEKQISYYQNRVNDYATAFNLLAQKQMKTLEFIAEILEKLKSDSDI